MGIKMIENSVLAIEESNYCDTYYCCLACGEIFEGISDEQFDSHQLMCCEQTTSVNMPALGKHLVKTGFPKTQSTLTNISYSVR